MSEEEDKKPVDDDVPLAADTEPGPGSPESVGPKLPESVGPKLPESDPLMYKSFPPAEPKPVGAISSGAFEISRASFSESPQSLPEDLPPSTVIANAMGRDKTGLSLGAMVGIAVGVLVVAIGLSLLLFR
jgi:hypothetical protein